MLPSPAELRYFLEIAHTSNLSRASERLGISQPSLSLSLKKLEQTVGAKLFIRLKTGVILTPAGKQFLLHVQGLLQHWENAKAQTLASEQSIQGCFTLGCPSTITIHMVTKFLPQFLAANPMVEIHLQQDISRKIVERIISLSIDIGICINPILHPDLIIRKLCNDQVGFWIEKNSLNPQTINFNEHILICDPELVQTQWLLKQHKKKNMAFKHVMTVNGLEAIAALAANGCGIGILPRRVATSMYPDTLIQIPNSSVYSDEICLIYRHENREIKAIQAIANTIKEFSFC